MIHAGIYYAPGSMRARLCVRGLDLMYAYCAAKRLPHEACGKVRPRSARRPGTAAARHAAHRGRGRGADAARAAALQLIVAVEPDELPRLHALYERGRANGVAGLRLLATPDEIRAVEPHCCVRRPGPPAARRTGARRAPLTRLARRPATPLVAARASPRCTRRARASPTLRPSRAPWPTTCAARAAPSTSATRSWPWRRPRGGPRGACASPAPVGAYVARRNACYPPPSGRARARLTPRHACTAVAGWCPYAQALTARYVLGCAGLYSDKVGRMLGAPAAPKIVGFRGEYLELKPAHRHLVRGLIYPVRAAVMAQAPGRTPRAGLTQVPVHGAASPGGRSTTPSSRFWASTSPSAPTAAWTWGPTRC